MEYCWRPNLKKKRSLRKEWNIHSLKIQNLYIQTTWNCLPENFLTVFYLPEIKENIWSALNKWLTPAVVRESIRSISGIFSSSDILIVAEGLEFFFTFSILIFLKGWSLAGRLDICAQSKSRGDSPSIWGQWEDVQVNYLPVLLEALIYTCVTGGSNIHYTPVLLEALIYKWSSDSWAGSRDLPARSALLSRLVLCGRSAPVVASHVSVSHGEQEGELQVWGHHNTTVTQCDPTIHCTVGEFRGPPGHVYYLRRMKAQLRKLKKNICFLNVYLKMFWLIWLELIFVLNSHPLNPTVH